MRWDSRVTSHAFPGDSALNSATQIKSDVLIAGAGMVGAALACALGEAGFRVTVVEAREPRRQWPADEIDNRVSALTRASQQLLENLGAWSRVKALGGAAYQRMHVWDRPGVGEIHFDAAAIGEPDLGHIVENRSIQLALWERMEAIDAIDIRCPASTRALTPRGLELENGEQLVAPLVVAADGGRSRVRDLAGIAVSVRSFEQLALVATVRVSQGHGRTAWQRFLPTGPLAFLPADTTDRCSIVWSTTPAEAERLMALDDNAFCRELGQAIDYRLGAVTETGPRATFPLRSQLAAHTVEEGLALVGDAAHMIHPLAGQGVNLGFLDAAELARVLITARDSGHPVGDYQQLRRYERARKGETLAVMRAMEGFNQLFSNRSKPLGLVRNLGLRAADTITPVKSALIRRAMGLTGDLPPLARPHPG